MLARDSDMAEAHFGWCGHEAKWWVDTRARPRAKDLIIDRTTACQPAGMDVWSDRLFTGELLRGAACHHTGRSTHARSAAGFSTACVERGRHRPAHSRDRAGCRV